jgi:hypothetical protein
VHGADPAAPPHPNDVAHFPPSRFFVEDDDADTEPGLALVARFAEGSPTAADIQAIARAARVWLRADGQVTLERILHLPAGFEARRRLERDRWLMRAAELLRPVGSQRAGCERLAELWLRFRCGSAWRAWALLAAPPADASELEEVLFHATRANRSKCLGAKQLGRVVGHVFSRPCPTVGPKVAHIDSGVTANETLDFIDQESQA